MEIAFAALADAANVASNGNLNVLGAFDTIGARRFPARHPAMVLAFRTRFEFDDQEQEHLVRITLIDEDHGELWGAEAKLKVGEVRPGQFGHTTQVIAFRDLTFPRAGRYTFRFSINEEVKENVIFQLVEASEQESPGE